MPPAIRSEPWLAAQIRSRGLSTQEQSYRARWPAEAARAPADRQRVEQGPGRVLVAAGAGIGDGTIDLL